MDYITIERPRDKRNPKQTRIRTSEYAYEFLDEMSIQSGMPITKCLDIIVKYAEDKIIYKEKEE